MRLFLTGGNGILGRALRKRLSRTNFELWAPGREELDITDGEACRGALLDFRPHSLIHAAAWTRVDDCEEDPDRAMEINGKATGRLAEASREVGTRLIYISTDYVFDGGARRHYREEDPPNPVNAYGRSKLEGETLVAKALDDYLIVRTSWLYGPGGPNFVDTIAEMAPLREKLRVVNDQRGSPTYAGELAGALVSLLSLPLSGILHVAGEGECTWFELAGEILKVLGLAGKVGIEPISSGELSRPAARPSYSVLDTSRFKRITGSGLRPWPDALRDYLRATG